MDISYATIPGNLFITNGYGYAGFNIVTALQNLGHRVPFSDPTAPVELFFAQPSWYDWSNPNAYHIGYTPWESTELPDDWVENMEEADEIWTPSPIIAEWYKEAGVTRPIKVYEHGVHSIWEPKRRFRREKLKFLHMGEPAPRKGGQMVFDAFLDAFGGRDDVHLTIKAHTTSTIRRYSRRGSIIGYPWDYKNVTLDKRVLETEELVQLVRSHHVMVYPSYGEGFGFIPLQGMATGMPTICTAAWAPYERFLLPELKLDATLGASPWPHIHPGKMFHPNKEHLTSLMLKAEADFDRLAGRAYKNSFAVHQDYNWETLTEKAFEDIVKKFS